MLEMIAACLDMTTHIFDLVFQPPPTTYREREPNLIASGQEVHSGPPFERHATGSASTSCVKAVGLLLTAYPSNPTYNTAAFRIQQSRLECHATWKHICTIYVTPMLFFQKFHSRPVKRL